MQIKKNRYSLRYKIRTRFFTFLSSSVILCALLIAAVTFVICLGGILIGRKVGTCMAGKAGILGGAILIFIGLEIFITSWF